MNPNDITIMQLDTKPKSRLYYYQGNFYHPIDLQGKLLGTVWGAIRRFTREKKAMITADRAHPDYRTLVQLFDEGLPNEHT